MDSVALNVGRVRTEAPVRAQRTFGWKPLQTDLHAQNNLLLFLRFERIRLFRDRALVPVPNWVDIGL